MHQRDFKAVVFYRTQNLNNSSEPQENLTVDGIERDEDDAGNVVLAELLIRDKDAG